MTPIVTPAEMAIVDAAAGDQLPILIDRAGFAVAQAALRMLGGGYGKRVVVIAGKGNNGADGWAAAHHLTKRGAKVSVLDAAGTNDRTSLPDADLVIDAAYGTGLRRPHEPPLVVAGTPVLAVDIPSGVDGLTGELRGGALHADRTITFAAWKPGLLLGAGLELSGAVQIADIGLDVGTTHTNLVEASDVAAWLPDRPIQAHKWQRPVWVIAGSPGMPGAARLATAAAFRAGAGYVRLSSPGMGPDELAPTEAVSVSLPMTGWAHVVESEAERFRSLVVGPGLGRSDSALEETRSLLDRVPIPVVLDGDGLSAHARPGGLDELQRRAGPTILTPHDGEYERLLGERPGPDRFAACRRLAEATGTHVLLKGPVTIVADPDGEVLAVDEGDARLATAGTGDVLAGVIGALLAGGLDPLRAAAAGAFLHARSGRAGSLEGLVASDLVDHLPGVISKLRRQGSGLSAPTTGSSDEQA